MDEGHEGDEGDESTDDAFEWSVERFSYFRGHLFVDGWAFHRSQKVIGVSVRLPDGTLRKQPGYGLESPDVAAIHGEPARACRFSLDLPVSDANAAKAGALVFSLRHRRKIVVEDLGRTLAHDPYHVLFGRYVELVRALPSPTVLEIGSRARSGNVNTGWLPESARYVGFDVVEGPNVDVVGDAHELSSYFAPQSVDSVFSISTIEHLAMPWKVVLELNKVLKLDSVAFFSTHQTWPVHEAPCDFWRFSRDTWPTIFNRATGFEVVDAAMGEHASVVADILSEPTAGLEEQPAFLGSCVIVRKTASTSLGWDVATREVTAGAYPH